jgi:hypothetical protein
VGSQVSSWHKYAVAKAVAGSSASRFVEFRGTRECDAGAGQIYCNWEMRMSLQQGFIDGKRVLAAATLNRVEPIYKSLAYALSAIPALHFVDLLPGRLSASNRLSSDERQAPVVEVGADGVTGVELLVDSEIKIVQFYAMTSTRTRCCRQMVHAVVDATPADWLLAVPCHWTSAFWKRMTEQCPRLQVW